MSFFGFALLLGWLQLNILWQVKPVARQQFQRLMWTSHSLCEPTFLLEYIKLGDHGGHATCVDEFGVNLLLMTVDNVLVGVVITVIVKPIHYLLPLNFAQT